MCRGFSWRLNTCTMYKIKCTTRFDITATGKRRPFKTETRNTDQTIREHQIWQKQRNQQSNWETINQLISLRCLPEDITTPVANQDHTWSFEFTVTDLRSIGRDDDELCYLRADADKVPMIVGLDEDTDTDTLLRTQDALCNTWFELVPINKSKGIAQNG